MVILILNLKKVKISSRIDWRHTHTQFCESPISRQAVSCRQMQGILVENQEGNHVKQLRLEISHGRFKKLGARFSLGAANLSGIILKEKSYF